MKYGMCAWIALSALTMILSRAFPLRSKHCGVRPEDVEFTLVCPRSLLSLALAMDLAGVILVWLTGTLPGMAQADATMVINLLVLAMLMAGAAYVCLIVDRFVVVVAGERIIVQPPLGRFYEFTFADIESVRVTPLVGGWYMLAVRSRFGRGFHAFSGMGAYDRMISRLMSAAVRDKE